MCRTLGIMVGLCLVAVLGAPALAGVSSEMQANITRELESKDYVAKVALYDAEVTQTGKVSSEYDKESIKKGHDIIILSVVFKSTKIRVKLKHPFDGVNTSVDFLFNQTLSSDFNREKEAFAKMVAAVFEEKGSDGVAMATGVSHAGEKDTAVSVDLGIPRLDEFSRVHVIIKGTPKVESHKKFKASAETLSDMLVQNLDLAGVFESVSAGVPEQVSATDLRITLLVDTFKYTSGGRYVGGIMAGKAKLGMLVTLTSGETGETVAEFPLSAISKRSHGVFGTTTVIQSGRMTEQIAQAIARQKRPE